MSDSRKWTPITYDGDVVVNPMPRDGWPVQIRLASGAVINAEFTIYAIDEWWFGSRSDEEWPDELYDAASFAVAWRLQS